MTLQEAASQPAAAQPIDAMDTVRIPVIEEQLNVTRQLIETGRVRLVKTVHEDEQIVAIPLVADQVEIERVPIGAFVDTPPATRIEGDTTIYPVLQEEYVVQKRLRLVEEIRVTRRQLQTTDQQTVTLRREHVTVERTAADTKQERSDPTGESTPWVDRPDESSL